MNNRGLMERQVVHNLVLNPEFREKALPMLNEDCFSVACWRAMYLSIRDTGKITVGYKPPFALDKEDLLTIEMFSEDCPSREQDISILIDYAAKLHQNTVDFVEGFFGKKKLDTDDEGDDKRFSYQDLREIVLGILGKARRPLSYAEIRADLDRITRSSIAKSNFGSRIMKPLIDEEKIFTKGEGKYRTVSTEPFLDLKQVSIAKIDESNSEEQVWPILPFFNEEMRTSSYQYCGGLSKGDFLLFNARTGVGKSFFYLHCARNAADLGLRVLYLDLENKLTRLQHRLGRVISGSDLSSAELKDVLKPYEDSLIIARIGQAGVLTIEQIRKEMADFDVLILDYLCPEKFQEALTAGASYASPGRKILQPLIDQLCEQDQKIIISGTQVIGAPYKERGQIVDVCYRGGASWIEPAPDVWTVIENDRTDYGSTMRIKIMKSRDRILAENRVVAVNVDYKNAQYHLV